MKNSEILKRLFKDYTTKYLNKMFLALIFAIVLAGSTSSVAYLLDPAIEKIFFFFASLNTFNMFSELPEVEIQNNTSSFLLKALNGLTKISAKL